MRYFQMYERNSVMYQFVKLNCYLADSDIKVLVQRALFPSRNPYLI